MTPKGWHSLPGCTFWGVLPIGSIAISSLDVLEPLSIGSVGSTLPYNFTFYVQGLASDIHSQCDIKANRDETWRILNFKPTCHCGWYTGSITVTVHPTLNISASPVVYAVTMGRLYIFIAMVVVALAFVWEVVLEEMELGSVSSDLALIPMSSLLRTW